VLTREQDDELVMGLVEMALGKPSSNREAYLRENAADDSELFDRVWYYIEWEERMQGFLLDPLYPQTSEPTFFPGELLDKRFRIVREVARGGMGIVYEAMDEKLERRIALKCAKAGFHKRLPPEVRNASEISHPNVCTCLPLLLVTRAVLQDSAPGGAWCSGNRSGGLVIGERESEDRKTGNEPVVLGRCIG
jgi:hypothetical protein